MDDRESKAESDRNIAIQDWKKHNEIIIEYGNFCIKMLVTLNSTAILACLAFVGSYSKNTSAVSEAVKLANILPQVLFCWALSLTFILISALSTYICHRWYPTLIFTWHKEEYPDIYGFQTFKEKISTPAYLNFVTLGILSGIVSLFTFLLGIWKIVFAL